jgi:transglutaminase-like putative cysteine protease
MNDAPLTGTDTSKHIEADSTKRHSHSFPWPINTPQPDCMIFRIKHVTRYIYEQPAYHSHNIVRLAPIDAPDQKRLEFHLDITPSATISEFRDSFGNLAHSIDLQPPHKELIISSTSVVERLMLPVPSPHRVSIRDYLANDSARMEKYAAFLNPSRYVPVSERLRRFFWSVRPHLSEDVTEYTERMIHYVRNQFAYDGDTTNVHSTVDDILTLGGGVCQDFAHLSIGLLRLAGIPARYVSGYLAPAPRKDANIAPPELASHAWIEALLPGTGWTGFDPTHRIRTIIRHIRVAIGRDYNDLPPVSGVYQSAGGTREMAYELEVSQATQNEPGSFNLR